MNISRLSLALCAFVFLAQARHVHAGPREDFDRLVQETQAAPADDKLRERIIAAALSLKPAPAIPIEARRHLSRAQGAIELAKQPGDMRLAVEELEKALRLAPWWAEAYYNLGVVQDKAGRYGDAVRSLRLYLRWMIVALTFVVHATALADAESDGHAVEQAGRHREALCG